MVAAAACRCWTTRSTAALTSASATTRAEPAIAPHSVYRCQDGAEGTASTMDRHRGGDRRRSGVPSARCSRRPDLPPDPLFAEQPAPSGASGRAGRRLRHGRVCMTRASSCTCCRRRASRPAPPRTPATRWSSTRSCRSAVSIPERRIPSWRMALRGRAVSVFGGALADAGTASPCLGEHTTRRADAHSGAERAEEVAELMAEAAV